MELALLQPRNTSGADATMINETIEHPRETQLSALSADNIKTVTASTFTRLVLEAEGPIAVEFMSYGCEHCRAIEPVLEQVAKVVEPGEKIFRVNIAVERDLQAATKFRARRPWSCF